MYLVAIRAASIAVEKASAGVAAAITGSGASPCRPYMAKSRSDCSTRVGIPVDGPARWTSMTISGNSIMKARLIDSDLRASPGPDVVVAATTCDLAALIDIDKPVVRVRYEFAEVGEPGLGSLVEAFLRNKLGSG